jgi:hypothetical protein
MNLIILMYIDKLSQVIISSNCGYLKFSVATHLFQLAQNNFLAILVIYYF